MQETYMGFLRVKQDFSNWIKDRIGRCDLVEGVDYQARNKIIECKNYGQVNIYNIEVFRVYFKSIKNGKYL